MIPISTYTVTVIKTYPQAALFTPQKKEQMVFSRKNDPSPRLKSLSKADLLSHAIALHNFRRRPNHEKPCEFFLWECLKNNAFMTAEALLTNELVPRRLLLFKALRAGCSHRMHWLISQDCDPNELDPTKQTVLHRAVAQKDWVAIQLLCTLPFPAINHLDSDGNTPLHIAYQSMDGIDPTFESIASYLLDQGASPKQSNQQGYLPKQVTSNVYYKNKQLEFIVGHINSIPDNEPHLYEGCSAKTMCTSLVKVLETMPLQKNEDQDLWTHLAKGFKEAAPFFPSRSLENSIQKGDLVIIPMSIQEKHPIHHTFYLVFAEDYYAICNRGYGLPPNHTTIEIFSICSARFRNRDITSLDTFPTTELQMDYLYHKLPVLLSGPKNPFKTDFNEPLSLPRQKVGNCTYANAKAALRVSSFFLLLKTIFPEKAVEQAKSLSKRASTHCRLFYLDKYCKERPNRDWYLFNLAWKKTKKRDLQDFNLQTNYPRLANVFKAYPSLLDRTKE